MIQLVLAGLEKIKSWFGLVWFGLKKYPSEGSVKVSSRSDLFWLFKRRLLVISLLNLSLCVGLNNPLILTQYVDSWVGLVMKYLTMYDTCMSVLCY